MSYFSEFSRCYLGVIDRGSGDTPCQVTLEKGQNIFASHFPIYLYQKGNDGTRKVNDMRTSVGRSHVRVRSIGEVLSLQLLFH